MTDKAVNATNTMGSTKRVAEMIVQRMDNHSSTLVKEEHLATGMDETTKRPFVIGDLAKTYKPLEPSAWGGGGVAISS